MVGKYRFFLQADRVRDVSRSRRSLYRKEACRKAIRAGHKSARKGSFAAAKRRPQESRRFNQNDGTNENSAYHAPSCNSLRDIRTTPTARNAVSARNQAGTVLDDRAG